MKVTWLALEWPQAGAHSGGVGRYLVRLAEQMRDLVDLTAVVFDDAVEVDGVSLVRLPRPSGRFQRYYSSAWLARRAVADADADVVHAHGDDFLLRRADGVPVVRSFYGSSWNEAVTSRGLRRLNHVVLAGGEKVSQRRSTVRLGIAPESLERFRCEHLVPPYLHDGRPPPERNPAATATVVFIGSFTGRKQGHLVQKAVQASRSKAANIRLVVVGPATDAASWAPWVEHRSGLRDDEISSLLSQAWLLASPSSYEGFGIPVLEALSHGVPVIAHPNPGSQYLAKLGPPATPLVLASEGQFHSAVMDRLRSGPTLSAEETAAAQQLVVLVTDMGSPQRLLSIYRDTVLLSIDGSR